MRLQPVDIKVGEAAELIWSKTLAQRCESLEGQVVLSEGPDGRVLVRFFRAGQICVTAGAVLMRKGVMSVSLPLR
ncbi:hypothetical protein [Pseudoalteromonas rubra]|uniref:hypothetical protein n=1 Tax=Pseudoalteromonas rubra TaxID=43658 RepID=UPI000F79C081|nr:hypothetical protein [Pseudoalteromonas rubra]